MLWWFVFTNRLLTSEEYTKSIYSINFITDLLLSKDFSFSLDSYLKWKYKLRFDWHLRQLLETKEMSRSSNWIFSVLEMSACVWMAVHVYGGKGYRCKELEKMFSHRRLNFRITNLYQLFMWVLLIDALISWQWLYVLVCDIIFVILSKINCFCHRSRVAYRGCRRSPND